MLTSGENSSQPFTRPWLIDRIMICCKPIHWFRPMALSLLLLGFMVSCKEEKGTRPFPEVFQKELANLHHLEHYRAGKNSYILGLETFCNRPHALPRNGRKTILDLKGTGSLRHIWETHGPGPSPFILEFYVDGEAEPSIRGPFDVLVEAAKACFQPYVPVGGSTLVHDSYNFYLPVPFERSLQIDLVADPAIDLVFLQLDYRLDDEAMKGTRLVQEPLADGKYRLFYQPDPPAKKGEGWPRTVTSTWRFAGDRTIRVDGPAIIRRLAINAKRQGVSLLIRFDDEASAAVNVDLADFFGPFRGLVLNNNQCYFPMPFGRSAEIEILGSSPMEEWQLELDIEHVERFESGWGYFHALHTRIDSSVAYLPFQVLSTSGSGKWMGMAIYDTHHDHGGGDFAVIDANTDRPSFLHGINGEDYFSFAFFGKGENFPYSEAFNNDRGRMRIHFENPYPFEESITISWGVTGGLSPRSVAYWYQDSPADLSRSGEANRGREWSVFGPITVNVLTEDGNTPDVSDLDRLFGVLPDPAALDAGLPLEAEHIMFQREFNGTYHGWSRQYASGNHLNLMYIYGHVMPALGANHHMGCYARCMLARTYLMTDREKQVTLQLSFDDPLQVFLNGEKVYSNAELSEGYTTRNITVDLKKGENTLLVKMLDTPNNNTMWAGISLRVLENSQ